MDDTRTSSLTEELVRGVKTALRLSVLLIMAGCQGGHWSEPEASIVERLAQSGAVQAIGQLLAR